MENVGFVLRTLRYMNWGLLEMGTIDQPLIPGLPDDLALRCLAKISHGYHGTLETVCRGWRKLFRSAEYSNYKAREGWSENWLFVLAGESKNQWVAYDPEADRWHPLPRIPTSHPDQEHLGFSCVCVLNKFLLIGGTYGTRDPVFPHQGAVTTNEVFQFDPFRKEWRKVASMRTPRSHFACSVVSGKVYVAGGRNTSLIEGLALAEVYNPLTDKISVPLNKEGDKDIVLGDLEHSRDVVILDTLPKVTLPKHLGGSGIRDLAIHSKCMLMKWHRRFIQEDFGLWKEVIVAKHGNSAQWEWNRIRFWLDKWTEDYTLKEAFSNIFNIARQPSHSIAPAQGWQLWESEAEPNKKFARSKFEELLSSVLPLVAAVVERLVVEALLCRLLAGFVELIPKLDNRSWMSWTILSSRRFIDAILESIRVSIIAHSP
ncbi:F-box/kelch-repeat protein [Capsicum annuum]|nr:F-box/kelch-repeat protein [Capsicum annuum]